MCLLVLGCPLQQLHCQLLVLTDQPLENPAGQSQQLLHLPLQPQGQVPNCPGAWTACSGAQPAKQKLKGNLQVA